MPIQTVLLDKNFLHGRTIADIQALAETHRLLMPCVLFYEMVSADEPKRSRLLTKFRRLEIPVHALKPLNDLLKLEMMRLQCCGRPSDHVESIDAEVVRQALEPGPHSPRALDLLAEQADYLQAEVSSYRAIIAEVRKMFPQLAVGNDEGRRAFQETAESVVAEAARMRVFYESMSKVPSPGMFQAPPAHLVDENWACFRLMQVKLLFAIEHVHRIGTIDQPAELSVKAFTRLEHDVLDQQYLIQGVLEGAFATEEKKLQRWFRLLRPDGELHCRPAFEDVQQ
ncbi:hypothetical protein [Pelomonas sp. KK5]|uniref:hypothetical protein n=1 Tax=Pelomonas sp. KK5 TaxID=1855730 RepID=UPI00097BEF41|nr:hypothetical protein [Pelomonas sp. KK5]